MTRSLRENEARMYWRCMRELHTNVEHNEARADTIDELETISLYTESLVLRALCLSAVKQAVPQARVGDGP